VPGALRSATICPREHSLPFFKVRRCPVQALVTHNESRFVDTALPDAPFAPFASLALSARPPIASIKEAR